MGFCVGEKQFSDDKDALNSEDDVGVKDEVEVNDGVEVALSQDGEGGREPDTEIERA